LDVSSTAEDEFVVLSSLSFKPEEFDVTVGLALGDVPLELELAPVEIGAEYTSSVSLVEDELLSVSPESVSSTAEEELVVLSSLSIKPEEFDVTVGLALGDVPLELELVPVEIGAEDTSSVVLDNEVLFDEPLAPVNGLDDGTFEGLVVGDEVLEDEEVVDEVVVVVVVDEELVVVEDEPEEILLEES